jgi:hypothetical protein
MLCCAALCCTEQGSNGATKALQYANGSQECSQLMPTGWINWLPEVGPRPVNATSTNVSATAITNTATAGSSGNSATSSDMAIAGGSGNNAASGRKLLQHNAALQRR